MTGDHTGTTLAAEWHVDEPQLRVTESDARAALRAVTGKPVIPARARLRFGPGRTCEAIARLLDRAIVRTEAAGLDPRLLVVADGSAQAGEDIVRVRRKAHGGGGLDSQPDLPRPYRPAPGRPARDSPGRRGVSADVRGARGTGPSR